MWAIPSWTLPGVVAPRVSHQRALTIGEAGKSGCCLSRLTSFPNFYSQVALVFFFLFKIQCPCLCWGGGWRGKLFQPKRVLLAWLLLQCSSVSRAQWTCMRIKTLRLVSYVVWGRFLNVWYPHFPHVWQEKKPYLVGLLGRWIERNHRKWLVSTGLVLTALPKLDSLMPRVDELHFHWVLIWVGNIYRYYFNICPFILGSIF